MKRSLWPVRTLALLSLVCPLSPAAAMPVLCVSETPEANESAYFAGIGGYIWTLEYFLSPVKILAEDFQVKPVGWLDTGAALADLGRYKAVILWDAPRRINCPPGNSDPFYSTRDVISDDSARKIVRFVEEGGALIVAGGTTSYGDGASGISGPTKYQGLRDSPLAAALPVEIPEGVTLAAFADKQGVRKAVKIVKEDPVIAGLDMSQWPVGAYHRLKAKATAEMLLATAEGEPLIARWTQGKGRVVCVAFSPRGSVLEGPGATNPVWPPEAVLWDRLVRWAVNAPFPDAKREEQLLSRYNALVTPPPKISYELKALEYPYGAHVGNPAISLSMCDLAFKFYRDCGFNTIVMQGAGGDDFLSRYTVGLEKNSLGAFLHPDPAGAARGQRVDPKDYAQVVLPGGEFALHYGQPYPCPNSPVTVKYAVAEYENFMPGVAKYPSIRGSFHDDEWAWNMGYRQAYEGNPGIGCYCPNCNEYFKKVTGKDAPPPVYREPGYVAPEDDLWLKWCQVIRQDAFRKYNQTIKDAVKKIRPDFLLSNYPGGIEGNLDLMVEEVYLDCWRTSELETLIRMDVRSNWREDRKRDKYPVWALIGIFRMPEDKAIYPETLRLTAGLCLGGGAKGMILWNSVNLWAPYMQHPGREPLYLEAKRLGEYLEKYGPMFLQLKKTDCPVWMLSGWFWVNSFDNYHLVPPANLESYDKEFPWWNFQIQEVAAPALLRAGLQTEFVTEKQLLSKELWQKKALVLPGLLYCREAVVRKVEDFIRQGGKVYVDQSTKVKIQGATVLPVDFSKWHHDVSTGKRPTVTPTEENYRKQQAMRNAYVEEAIPVLQQQMVPAVQPQIAIDSTLAVYSMLENGDTRYLFIYNSDRDKGHPFTVTGKDFPPHIYDVNAGGLVNAAATNGGRSFSLDLPAGGWKVFALAPEKLDKVMIHKAAVSANALKLRVGVLTAAGKPFRAAVPLKITLHSDQGDTVLYRSTSAGTLDLKAPMAADIPKPQSILVEELFSGRTDKKTGL